MRIPLKFINGQVIANLAVSCAKYRIRYARVQFLVDTGSTRSFFSEGQAMAMGIPMNSLTPTELVNMGGSKYSLFQTAGFEFHFKTDSNEIHPINCDRFFVSRTTKKTQEAKMESNAFPCILGTDFFTTPT